MIHQHLNGIEQRLFAAGGSDRLVRLVIRAEICGMALHDGLAQLRHAAHRGVFGEILLDGGDAGVFDMAWSVEMRLAHAQVAQVDALGAQLGRFGGHRDGG